MIPLGQFLDVLGCNEYVGWYDGPPEKAAGLNWKVTLNKPLIISEFGGDAVYGLRGDKSARWTEEYQKNLYEQQIAMLRKIPRLPECRHGSSRISDPQAAVAAHPGFLQPQRIDLEPR